VRGGEQVLGDIHSFIAANAIGAERLQRLHGRLRDGGSLGALAEVVQGLSERAMRAAIRAIPDGELPRHHREQPAGPAAGVSRADHRGGRGDGHRLRTAPPRSSAVGGLNCTLNYTAAHATYPLKCMLTPGVRGNAGCYRPFTVTAPEGSILNCGAIPPR
jgi:5-oxoprolinase (ATP-hydrolysing)